MNLPRSNLFVNRHAPWPSCQINFIRSPRRPRKQNKCPLSGSCFKTSCTCRASDGKPRLMSVCPVASQTRTPLGITQAAPVPARQGSGLPRQHRDRQQSAVRSRSRSRSDQPMVPCSSAGPQQQPQKQSHPDHQAGLLDTPCATQTGVGSRSHDDVPLPTPDEGPKSSPRQYEASQLQPSDGADRCQQSKGG